MFTHSSILMKRANDWLRRRPSIRVRTCESIEVKGRLDGYVDSDKGSYYEPDHMKRRNRNMYIRALRLVVKIRTCVRVCLCVFLCVCVCLFLYVCVYLFLYVCLYVCLCVCLYVCSCMCVRVYVSSIKESG